MIKISEIFGPTIQGEGPYSGKPATFIRTYGCMPPFCDFCDTKYSWYSKDWTAKDIDDVVKDSLKYTNDKGLVIVTGGEPFMQSGIYDLLNKLEDIFETVQVETSGKAPINYKALKPEIEVVMSPKVYNGKFKLADDATLTYANYYKFVIGTEDDFELAKGMIDERHMKKEDIYLMPLGAGREEHNKNLEFVANKCIEHGYNFSPRLHVMIWDTKRGV